MIIKPSTPNGAQPPADLPVPEQPLVQFHLGGPCDVTDEHMPSMTSTPSASSGGGMGLTQSSMGGNGSSRLSSQTLELAPPVPMFANIPNHQASPNSSISSQLLSRFSANNSAAGAPIVLPPAPNMPNAASQPTALPSKSMSMANTTAEGQKPQPGVRLRDPNDKGPKQLIVKFLAPQVTEVELRQLFQQFGPVEYSRMIYDASSGTSKGYGFVYYYRSADAAEAVAGLDSFELYGRYLRVGFAIPQRQPPAPPPV